MSTYVCPDLGPGITLSALEVSGSVVLSVPTGLLLMEITSVFMSSGAVACPELLESATSLRSLRPSSRGKVLRLEEVEVVGLEEDEEDEASAGLMIDWRYPCTPERGVS